MIAPPLGFAAFDGAAFWQLDAAALVTLGLAAVTLAVLGVFLVLRREAMLGDALAHAALPGLVLAWLVTGSRGPLAMTLGALAAGLVTSALAALVTRLGRVERGAGLGVVFTALFALGVLLIETTGARQVDLDLGCVLSGQLELLVWPGVTGLADLGGAAAWRALPSAVVTQAAVCAATLAFVAAARRPLALATFDPRFAATVGARPAWFGGAYLALVTLAVVAAFEAVGTLLVIGLLAAPAATLRARGGASSRSVGTLCVAAGGVGLVTAWVGYGAATVAAPALGLPSLDVAGTVAMLGGLGLAAARWSRPGSWPRRPQKPAE